MSMRLTRDLNLGKVVLYQLSYFRMSGESRIRTCRPVKTSALIDWADEIFNFHDAGRVTNGRLEGTNNKLGVLKRTAYGFVDLTNFRARAILITPGVPP